MANPEHVERLRRGVESWNSWRSESGVRVPDFRGADLADVQLGALHAPDVTGEQVVLDLREPQRIDVDLSGADFAFANLAGANLIGAQLDGADFTDANLERANVSLGRCRRTIFFRTHMRGVVVRHALLYRAHVSGANLTDADLSFSDLSSSEASGASFERAILRRLYAANSDFTGAVFDGADLTHACLAGANLWHAKMRGALIAEADLRAVRLVDVDLSGATLIRCAVHGVSAWDLQLNGATQSELHLTSDPLFDDTTLQVDDIEVAQFLYLLIENSRLRKIVEQVTSRVVLLLGSFAPDGQAILRTIRSQVAAAGFVPVIFDFTKPATRDLTETIRTLAHLARFIIADVTAARSVPQELAAIIPHLPSVLVQPLVNEAESTYALFESFARYPWVLPLIRYSDAEALRQQLPGLVRRLAEQSRHGLES